VGRLVGSGGGKQAARGTLLQSGAVQQLSSDDGEFFFRPGREAGSRGGRRVLVLVAVADGLGGRVERSAGGEAGTVAAAAAAAVAAARRRVAAAAGEG
jgi:hypothetical protein